MTRDSHDNLRATHERLLKAYNSLVVLINTETMFRYLDETLVLDKECPKTNNPIEGGVNAQLRRFIALPSRNVCRKTYKSGLLVVLFTLTKTAFCKRNT